MAEVPFIQAEPVVSDTATPEETDEFILSTAGDAAATYVNLKTTPGLSSIADGLASSVEAEINRNTYAGDGHYRPLILAYVMTAAAFITGEIENTGFDELGDSFFWLRTLSWHKTLPPMPFFFHLAQLKYAQSGNPQPWIHALLLVSEPLFNTTLMTNEQFQKQLVATYLSECVSALSRDYTPSELIEHVAHDIAPHIQGQPLFDAFCEAIVPVLRRSVSDEEIDAELDYMNELFSAAAAQRNLAYVPTID